MSDTSPQQLPTRKPTHLLARFSEAQLPPSRGAFRGVVFREKKGGREHVALVRGDVEGVEGVPVRVHSECLTSEVFGSLKCDCRDQLDRAMEMVAQLGRGVVLYLRQEGRGIGLGNKIKAYALQNKGADTVEANHQLGFPADARDYSVAVALLHKLGLKRVRLMTNNPQKLDALRRDGVDIVERVAVERGRNPHNAAYLDTKALK